LVRPFTTSFGTTTEKDVILVRAIGPDGLQGWGECVCQEEPRYSDEWNDGAWATLRDFLVPAALAGDNQWVRGHPMAKASLELALLDLELRRRGVSLASWLGGIRDRVPCGVSLGIEDDLEELLRLVEAFLAQGYRRVKLKIRPGLDVEVVRAVRSAFPKAPLSVDANAAYGLQALDTLTALDAFGLEYIEQPFGGDDLLAHADLQARLDTPICLDESITSAEVAGTAIRLGACRVINVKLGRVGGLVEAKRLHDVAEKEGIPVWCGGMLETGLGRAANLALASLPNFLLPGDTSGSARYFTRDLTEPFVVDADGTMRVPDAPGIGVDPIPDVLEEATVDRLSLST
jgi:O-succinylbenzoate synthase